MTQQCSPPWERRHSRSERAGYASPGMRVSDADRTEVADRLSKHYSDGRLDETEFNERLDQAMKAKTRSGLNGLFADLPDLPGTEKSQPQATRTHAHPFQRAIFLILVAVITVVVWHAMAHAFVPWLLTGFLAFLVLRFGVLRSGPGRQRRR